MKAGNIYFRLQSWVPPDAKQIAEYGDKAGGTCKMVENDIVLTKEQLVMLIPVLNKIDPRCTEEFFRVGEIV